MGAADGDGDRGVVGAACHHEAMVAREGDASTVEDRVARPTNADVARLAKVSTATVSYVLNNAASFRPFYQAII